MLRMSGSLMNRPIMSLRSGTAIATAVEPVINPNNLKIMGWWCRVPSVPKLMILLVEDIREIMPGGFAVNDDAVLSTPHELVRHKEILDVKFSLKDKVVKTKSQKLGKVSDYNYDETSMLIQKLYVSRSLVKVFSNDNTLIIDRNQILEVTDDYILVEDAEATVTEDAPAIAAEAA